jgi:hypothetical protein
MTPVEAANSDAYLTPVSDDRLETQRYLRILGWAAILGLNQ